MTTKRAVKSRTFILPAYWASYLVNGDASGIDPGEREQVDGFISRNGLRLSGFVSCGDSYFARSNDAGNGLAGEVCEFTYHERARPAARSTPTDAQRLDFVLAQGLLVDASGHYEAASHGFPTRADIDRAMRLTPSL